MKPGPHTALSPVRAAANYEVHSTDCVFNGARVGLLLVKVKVRRVCVCVLLHVHLE